MTTLVIIALAILFALGTGLGMVRGQYGGGAFARILGSGIVVVIMLYMTGYISL